MTARALHAFAIGAVVACAGCGYPEFGFAPTSERDSAIDDADDDTASEAATEASIDSTTDDSAGDAGDAASDAADASDARDAGAETRVDAADAGDSIVATDTARTDAPDAPDAPETLSPCAQIDDLEDGDGRLLVRCGRDGYWSTFNDGTVGATQTPAQGTPFVPASTMPARSGSLFAARTYGSGFTGYGAGMGFGFKIPSGTPYDASAWTGIAFWARIGAGSVTTRRLQIPDGNTDPAGAVCTTKPAGCYDHFGIDLTFTTAWQHYAVRFSELTQQGWGTPEPGLAASRVFGVYVQGGSPAAFDLWIDDVTFLP